MYLQPGQEPPTKGKGSKLSAKMEKFVDEFFVDRNASAAVIRAGYSSKNPNRMAAKLMCHPLVKAEIDKRTETVRANTELRAEYLISKLVDIIENEGEKTADQLRAIELAGKSIALWKERQELSGPDGEAIKMEQKTKEDAADFTSRLSRLAKQAGTGEVVKFPNGGAEGSA